MTKDPKERRSQIIESLIETIESDPERSIERLTRLKYQKTGDPERLTLEDLQTIIDGLKESIE